MQTILTQIGIVKAGFAILVAGAEETSLTKWHLPAVTSYSSSTGINRELQSERYKYEENFDKKVVDGLTRNKYTPSSAVALIAYMKNGNYSALENELRRHHFMPDDPKPTRNIWK